MKDQYLLENTYEEVINEEYWEYLMHLAELDEEERSIIDAMIEETYITE